MKRLLATIMALLLTVGLAACGTEEALQDPEEASAVSREEEIGPEESEPGPEPAPEADEPEEDSQPEQSQAETSEQQAQPIQESEPEFELKPEQDSYPAGTKSITVTIVNNTGGEGSADMYYTVERNQNGVWEQVGPDPETDFLDVGIILEAGGSHGFAITLGENYPAGSYRVVKKASTAAGLYEAAAQFTLTDSSGSGVSMKAAQPSYPASINSFPVTIYNNTGKQMETGTRYSIQVKQDGAWKELPMDLVFDDPLLYVEAGGSREFSISLRQDAHSYQPGDYRVLKEVWISGSQEKQQLAAEFSLREGGTVAMKTGSASYPVGTKQVKVTITNTTGTEATLDNFYEIHRKKDGMWEPVPLEFEVTQEVRLLPDGKNLDMTISLWQDQYDYQPGSYRVVKRAGTAEGGYQLTAGFTLL